MKAALGIFTILENVLYIFPSLQIGFNNQVMKIAIAKNWLFQAYSIQKLNSCFADCFPALFHLLIPRFLNV